MYVPNFIYCYVQYFVFCVLFVCECVLYYWHRVSTQLLLTVYMISYHITSYHIKINPSAILVLLYWFKYNSCTTADTYTRWQHWMAITDTYASVRTASSWLECHHRYKQIHLNADKEFCPCRELTLIWPRADRSDLERSHKGNSVFSSQRRCICHQIRLRGVHLFWWCTVFELWINWTFKCLLHNLY
jgi:hypothetical protein